MASDTKNKPRFSIQAIAGMAPSVPINRVVIVDRTREHPNVTGRLKIELLGNSRYRVTFTADDEPAPSSSRGED